ncbi:MATE family efflux transporter [Paraburkholderia tropica]|uniref:MATE family efflux transporter n=1 Tax=Paraburkholderia tropica TaxID=92647 RepID=UPI00301989DF
MTVRTARLSGEWRALLTLCGPLALVQLCQMAMTAISTAVLGHLGSVALAGGGLGAAIGAALVLVAQGVVAGLQPLAAQNAKAAERAQILVAALLVALACSVPVALALLNVSHVLALLGMPTAVAQAALDYCTACAWGAPFALCVASLRYFLVAVRRTRAVMAIAAGATLCNGVLSCMLAYGKWGSPVWGVRGVGIAWSLTWAAMLVALACYAVRVRLCPLAAVAQLPDAPGAVLERVRGVVRVGWPIAVGYASEIWLFLLFSTMVARFGTASLSAHQLALNLVNAGFMVPLALAQTATVRVAQHWGSGLRQHAARAAALTLGAGAAYAGLCGTLLVAFPDGVVRLFVERTDTRYVAVEQLANTLFALGALYIAFDALQAIAAGALRGMQKTRAPMLIVVCGYWGLGLPLAWALSRWITPAVVGIWTGIALAASCVAALMLWLLWRSEIFQQTRPRALGTRITR